MDERDGPGVSDVALASAREMRLFDAALTDEQIEAIARRIDAARAAARRLDAPVVPLANGDEPVTRFVLGARDTPS